MDAALLSIAAKDWFKYSRRNSTREKHTGY